MSKMLGLNNTKSGFKTLMCLISCLVCVASLALILYVANAYLGQMFETLVKADAGEVDLKDVKINLKVGFFLLIPYICFNMVSILMVYLYVHAAYTRRKEQEKPTEDAPKEIMMY